MEELTEEKFDTQYNYISLERKKIYGLMSAKWLTDTLFVKKARKEEDSDIWLKKSFLRLVFENGKLIDMKGIVNKIEISIIDMDEIRRKIDQRKNKNSISQD